MSWQKVKLGELGEFRNGLNYSKANEGSGLKVISVKDFGDLRVPNFAELDEINPSGLNIRNSLLAAGDIIFVRSNGNKDLIGRSMFIEKAQENVSFSGFCIRFRNQSDFAHSKFLAYYFRSPIFRRTLSNLGGGTNINNLNQGVLGNFPILLPSLDQQETILRTLSAYDDLIENNRRRIGLLEQAARLLYREWFVHLRFPGHETAKIVDGLPEGWRYGALHEAFEQFIDGDWIESKDQGGEDFRILQISNVGVNSFVETGNWRFISGDTFRRLRCTEVLPGDFLLSRMPTPIGRAWRVTPQPFRMVTAVDVTIARPASSMSDMYLLFAINSDQHLAQCEGHAVGATRQRISRKNMGNLPLLFPTSDVQDKFQAAVNPLNRQQTLLDEENKRLARARDLLLPRLMDGRIPV